MAACRHGKNSSMKPFAEQTHRKSVAFEMSPIQVKQVEKAVSGYIFVNDCLLLGTKICYETVCGATRRKSTAFAVLLLHYI